MHPLIEELLKEAPVIIDGAWGTELQKKGLPNGGSPEEWNLSHPDIVRGVAASYVDVGCRIVLTNTFGGSRILLERHGLADKTAEVNRRAAELSKEAAGDRAKVFASIGPTGKVLMMENYSDQEIIDVFKEQAMALAEGGADALVVETMSDLHEAKLALAAAKTTGLPVVSCMSYDSGPEKAHTMMGIEADVGARELTEAGADVIGANCGQGINEMVIVCKKLRESTNLPVWIKGNASIPKIIGGEIVYPMSADEFADTLPSILDAGADFVGGCCGTSPEFIRELVTRKNASMELLKEK